MFSTWTSSTAGIRRIGIALTLTAAVILASVGMASAQAAAPAQAPAAAPAVQTRTFTGDVGVMSYIVKGDKAADFEALIVKLKDALAKSEKPDRKAQGAGWRVLKQVEARPDGNITYLFLIDPVVKDADYTFSAVLYEAFPMERQAVYEAIKASVVGSGMVNYQSIMAAVK
jgi:hypothetical protein